MSYTIYFMILTVLWATIWSCCVWFFRTRRTRGPLFRRLTRKRRILLVCVFVAMPCIYCLSYAPFMRLLAVAPDLRPGIGALDDLYVPVQWLIDQTALREPLLSWAGIWHVSPQPLMAASAARMRFFWGTTPPSLYAAGWLLIGIAWCVIPPYLLHRLLHCFQTKHKDRTVRTQTAT